MQIKLKLYYLAFIRRFLLNNFNKRPMIVPKFTIPNINTILHAISKDQALSVVSDYLASDFITKNKLKVIWNGKRKSSNMLYLAYDKTKISHEKLQEIKKIII